MHLQVGGIMKSRQATIIDGDDRYEYHINSWYLSDICDRGCCLIEVEDEELLKELDKVANWDNLDPQEPTDD